MFSNHLHPLVQSSLIFSEPIPDGSVFEWLTRVRHPILILSTIDREASRPRIVRTD